MRYSYPALTAWLMLLKVLMKIREKSEQELSLKNWNNAICLNKPHFIEEILIIKKYVANQEVYTKKNKIRF